MQSKRTILLALAMLVLVLPFGTGIAAADSGTSQGNALPVSLALQGEVANAGTQAYALRGGQLIMGSVMGNEINPYTATLQYSMFSFVYGANVWGVSRLELSAETLSGQSVNVAAWTFLNESESVAVPLGCSGNTCTSQIPEFFLGGSVITTTINGVTQTTELPLAIESAYLNPFGRPIVISSMDPQTSILLVATYSVGTIDWYGVQMAGYAAGTIGGSPVQGTFAMNVNSRENLVTGIEYDQGTIALIGAGVNGNNAQGPFRGVSMIPTQGAFPCPSSLGLPAGTCTMTGLNSTGTMSLHSGSYQIAGSYHTIWTIPALAFGTQVSATATHQTHRNNW